MLKKSKVKVLLGICGGIAAYKSAYLASLLVKKSYDVKTVMTKGAVKFIAPLTFEALTGNCVHTDLFEKVYDESHTSLSKWADIIIIAPLTAATMAKLAHGISDDLLSVIVLDYKGPIFLCPAMHENMWRNPAASANMGVLKKRGFYFIGPVKGRLAGGSHGEGRMTEPEEILKYISRKCSEEKRSIKNGCYNK